MRQARHLPEQRIFSREVFEFKCLWPVLHFCYYFLIFHRRSVKLSKILMQISRLFLGVVFLVAIINGYFVIFGFDPFIDTSPEAMALFEFEYLLIIEKSLEIICGILLLFNQFIPIVIAIFSPIVINIVLLHLFLDPSLLLLAVLLLLALGYLLFYFRANFISILEKNPKPLQ